MFSEGFTSVVMDRSQYTSPLKKEISLQGKEAHSIKAGEIQLIETCLIQSTLAGDLSAFNQLAAMYQDSLYGWVFSLVKDEAAAEDITQSTLITAYERLNSFRGGSFKSWIFTIARNRSYDELRRRQRHPSLSLEETLDDDRNRLELIPARTPLPEDTLITTEQAALIEQMLNRLPGIARQVVRLIDLEGLDYREAADILGLPLGTVKSRLTRARLKLRSLFQEANWL